MRHTSFRLAILIVSLIFPAVGHAGFINLSSSTKLNADVNASLTRISDKVADSHESHDVGSLSKTSAAANASASLPIDAATKSVTTGAANASLSGSNDAFQLSGSAASNLPVNCPFDALTQSVSTASVPFTLATGGSAKLNYALNINAMVTNDEKVTVVLTHTGETKAIFSHVFTNSATDSLSLSDAGSYQLLLIAGAVNDQGRRW